MYDFQSACTSTADNISQLVVRSHANNLIISPVADY